MLKLMCPPDQACVLQRAHQLVGADYLCRLGISAVPSHLSRCWHAQSLIVSPLTARRSICRRTNQTLCAQAHRRLCWQCMCHKHIHCNSSMCAGPVHLPLQVLLQVQHATVLQHPHQLPLHLVAVEGLIILIMATMEAMAMKALAMKVLLQHHLLQLPVDHHLTAERTFMVSSPSESTQIVRHLLITVIWCMPCIVLHSVSSTRLSDT